MSSFNGLITKQENIMTWSLATEVILAGQQTDGSYRSITAPIYQTANFRFEEPGTTPEFDYSRSGNPTRSALEEILAQLENGAGAVACNTGMGAITTVLAHFQAGDHIICAHDCYGGTARLLKLYDEQGKLEVSFVDLTNPERIKEAIKPNTRAIWVETPSNPLLRITDLTLISSHAAEADILCIVDNTFLSPLFQQPISFGADLVVHSTTKYLNGHSDVIGGAIIARTEELHQRFAWLANVLGVTASPFDCWLVLRGIKTLAVRLEQHAKNAQLVAEWLEGHPDISRVFYPGLPSHPGHELACRQQKGFGGIISFEFDGTADELKKLLGTTRLFALAESLGGVESLIEHPATMSHASMTPELRQEAGITEKIVRLSVGIEHIDDIIEDLDQAIAFAKGKEKQTTCREVAPESGELQEVYP